MTKITTKDNYIKLKNQTGIYKQISSEKYQARKKVKGVFHKKTFSNVRDAANWFRLFNGVSEKDSAIKQSTTLKEVWACYQADHFPTLADSTKEIWLRRYILLSQLEDFEMHKLTVGTISGWVERNVSYYKSSDYEGNCRGSAKRCNLDNELNLFTTIFNWYKTSENFERESQSLTNPVRTQHKKLGFIRAKIKVHKAIGVDDAFKFFSYLSPVYRDLATFQYYTASRIGEVAGLQWTRINFERREIIIMETCQWDMSNKTFIKLNPHPKNREPRPVYMTDELMEILKRMEHHKVEGCNFVFHILGNPLNYCTIQLHFREAQRKSNLPYTGTHILRHGMATLARKVFGGLDGAIAMTGHKDFKLADHYSKDLGDLQKEVSLKIMKHIHPNGNNKPDTVKYESNVLQFTQFKKTNY